MGLFTGSIFLLFKGIWDAGSMMIQFGLVACWWTLKYSLVALKYMTIAAVWFYGTLAVLAIRGARRLTQLISERRHRELEA